LRRRSLDGEPHAATGRDRSITISQLEPETTYTFAVQARDYGENLSPFSDPVTVTTAAPNSVDTTPPTRPGSFEIWDQGCGEVWLFWTQSTDDFDDLSLIRYNIYVNGMRDHSVMGDDFTITYGDLNGLNVFDITAVDTSGNESGPATVDIDLDLCF
jgi:hypothetical protein